MKHFTYIIILSCIFLTSCKKDNSIDEIDENLQEALIVAGEDLSFFQQPKSTNFSSIPQDPNNTITSEKVELGKLLFHETAFATAGEFPITKFSYSCASCHHAGAGFQAGIAQGLGEGGEGFGVMGEGRIRNELCDPTLCDVQPIRTPTVLNGAYQPLMLWNGQFGATSLNEGTDALWTEGTPKEVNHLGFEGLETQAIAGLEVHRMMIDAESVNTFGYKDLFDSAFGDINEAERYSITTAGLAIAAYERTILANESPFQKYLGGDLDALTSAQKEGAYLFFSKAECYTCHTGPALSKMEFHALGMNEFDPSDVTHYDPEDPTKFGRYSFTGNESDKYLFKTPQLYNLKQHNFFGHGASFTSIKEIIEYKNKGIPENSSIPSNSISDEFKPLGLSDDEVEKLVDFIENGLFDPNIERYVPESLPSGNCFPNNDEISQEDLGCN